MKLILSRGPYLLHSERQGSYSPLAQIGRARGSSLATVEWPRFIKTPRLHTACASGGRLVRGVATYSSSKSPPPPPHTLGPLEQCATPFIPNKLVRAVNHPHHPTKIHTALCRGRTLARGMALGPLEQCDTPLNPTRPTGAMAYFDQSTTPAPTTTALNPPVTLPVGK